MKTFLEMPFRITRFKVLNDDEIKMLEKVGLDFRSSRSRIMMSAHFMSDNGPEENRGWGRNMSDSRRPVYEIHGFIDYPSCRQRPTILRKVLAITFPE
jgi:hypothetical protein